MENSDDQGPGHARCNSEMGEKQKWKCITSNDQKC